MMAPTVGAISDPRAIEKGLPFEDFLVPVIYRCASRTHTRGGGWSLRGTPWTTCGSPISQHGHGGNLSLPGKRGVGMLRICYHKRDVGQGESERERERERESKDMIVLNWGTEKALQWAWKSRITHKMAMCAYVFYP